MVAVSDDHLGGRAETCVTRLASPDTVFSAFPPAGSSLVGGLTNLERGLAAARAAVARRDWDRALKLLATASALSGQLRRGREGIRVRPSALLTPKEGQVLQLLGRRLSNKQIAAALAVGDATVKWHLKNLYVKLNVGTREHARRRARMLGILEIA